MRFLFSSDFCRMSISVQFMAMGMAISTLTRLSYSTSLLISACIILIYTGRGGIRAVTFTDVLQFIAFFLIIPILFIRPLAKVKNVSKVGLQWGF